MEERNDELDSDPEQGSESFLDAAPPSPVATPVEAVASRPILETEGLRYEYGPLAAVDGLDLSVREGEIYGFLGRNGAGKTTTIRMLMGVLKPRAGSLRFFGGKSLARTGIAQKRRIGYVSQTQYFYPWMNANRLGKFVGGLYPTWDRQEFARLLEAFEVPPSRPVSNLSGGMSVKLALALALAPRPDLLILDEPMAGLDAVARREFLDTIKRQTRRRTSEAEGDQPGRTTFFSSHRIDEVERICDRVGIIDRGRLVHEGTVAELRRAVRELRSLEATVDPAALAPLPDGFRLLLEEQQDDGLHRVVMADPERWPGAEFPGFEVADLSLEDIFVSLVHRDSSVR